MTESTQRRIAGLLDELFAGQERLTQAEIYHHAVAADLPADVLLELDALPEGEYTADEAAEALRAGQAP